jgi:hypothetical protein
VPNNFFFKLIVPARDHREHTQDYSKSLATVETDLQAAAAPMAVDYHKIESYLDEPKLSAAKTNCSMRG